MSQKEIAQWDIELSISYRIDYLTCIKLLVVTFLDNNSNSHTI